MWSISYIRYTFLWNDLADVLTSKRTIAGLPMIRYRHCLMFVRIVWHERGVGRWNVQDVIVLLDIDFALFLPRPMSIAKLEPQTHGDLATSPGDFLESWWATQFAARFPVCPALIFLNLRSPTPRPFANSNLSTLLRSFHHRPLRKISSDTRRIKLDLYNLPPKPLQHHQILSTDIPAVIH